jgi:TolB-like protein/DNA-binding winged helix-turn-helix (wHTH) protein
MPPPLPSQVRFADFEVDLRAGQLRKQGLKIRLQEQPFCVLTALLEASGEVVTREELRTRLWPADTFVDFDHRLAAAISKLRDALKDSAENPRFVETIGRRGYRFMVRVEPVLLPVEGNQSQAFSQLLTVPESWPSRPTRSKFRVPGVARAAWTVAVLALFLVFGFFALRHRRQSDVTASAVPRISSIAVLPLENLSDDPDQEYFAEGMTDEIITDLAKLPKLRVISRTSAIQYKSTHKTLPQIARELNVDAILEGTVLRAGNRVRIRTQLIYAPADRHIWAQAYERDLKDVLAWLIHQKPES